MNKRQRVIFSWVLIAIYAIVTIGRRTFAPNLLSPAISTGLATFVPFIFLFVHGSLSYRLRDLLVFVGITLVVSNILENMSVITGFPFGHYDYTDTLGPKLFLVPILIGPAYVATGYLAWTIARVIAGATDTRLLGHLTFSVPLLAAFMMVSWDLSMDPLFSTINQSWVWRDGGSYFGVPVSNFFGWLLTTYVFFQLFALYLKGRSTASATNQSSSAAELLQALVFYGLIGAGYLLNILKQDLGETVADPAGVIWRAGDIYAVTGLLTLFTMGTFILIGLVRLAVVSSTDQNASREAISGFTVPYNPERQLSES